MLSTGFGVPGAGPLVPEDETWTATLAVGVIWRCVDIGNPLVDIHHQIPKINTQLSNSRPAPINNSQPRRDCGKKEVNQPIKEIITKRTGRLFGDTLFFINGQLEETLAVHFI
jgi:hypothetical protein